MKETGGNSSSELGTRIHINTILREFINDKGRKVLRYRFVASYPHGGILAQRNYLNCSHRELIEFLDYVQKILPGRLGSIVIDMNQALYSAGLNDYLHLHGIICIRRSPIHRSSCMVDRVRNSLR